MTTYSNKILKRIRGKRRGWVFIPKDFLDIAPRNAISQVLFRLTKQGIIRQLSRGIYDFPILHDKLGPLSPNPNQLAHAFARQTHDIIQPSGATIVNQLGFDTQVPAKNIYLTSGQSKQRRVANFTIQFKHSKIVNQFKEKPKLSQIILALQHLGKDHIDPTIINKCRNILTSKDKTNLAKLMTTAPMWMAPYINKITGSQHGKFHKTKQGRTTAIHNRGNSQAPEY